MLELFRMISFLRRNRSTVGLDIGSGSIKVAVVDHSGSEPEVTHLGQMPLISDAIVEGEIMDPQLVSATVRSLLDEMGVSSKRVVASVGGRDLIVKRIQMDRMKLSEARELIRWEAEQHVPFEMENVKIEFQILDPNGSGPTMQVLLVVAKRDLIDQKVALLRDAAVTASVLDVDAFALYNAFEYNYPDAQVGTVALVNIGNEISTVNLLQDGSPALTRDVHFGTRHLREDLRRAHGLTAAEAEEAVEGRSARRAEFQDLLADRAEELATGIERAVAFLEMGSLVSARSLAKVFLCGGGARVPGFPEAVGSRLNVRTEVASPFERLRVRPGAGSLVPLEELAPMLMLTVGLALRRAS